MAIQFQVVVDADDPHTLADWWAAALEWTAEPSDEDFIRSMIDQGMATQDDTTTHRGTLVWKVGAAIIAPDGETGPASRILFQAVPEAKAKERTVKNSWHLDLKVGEDRLEAERDRLIAAGATFHHEGHQGPSHWFTLTDPEGNFFCIAS